MPFWTYKNLAEVTQGTWLVEPNNLQGELTGLWHDTRDIKPGQAYLAIAGDNFDGHDFIDQAFNAGATLAIVSKTPSPKPQASSPILIVEDTVKALQDLARAYRDELKAGGCKVIGIAGSNGKTTTRHLIHHVLTHAGLKGIQSPKSFNNHLGVPLTLLSGKPQDDFVACEIGTNHPGEINFLSAIARPDIAVITSIGEEHMAFFGDLENVAREELSIINCIVSGGDLVLGNIQFWHTNAVEMASDRICVHDSSDAKLQPPVDSSLLGEHNRINAAVTKLAAQCLGVADLDIHGALKTVEPPAHRCVPIQYGSSVLVIDDCYNANPTSVIAALHMLHECRPGTNKVAILGDMFELGDQAQKGHRRIGQYAAGVPVMLDHLIAIGGYAKTMVDAFSPKPEISKANCFEQWSDDLPDKIAALLEPGDTVLLKASRGMRLERLIPAIEQRFGAAQDDQPT